MSCTTCGSKKNCHCSDNCPNKASDITTFDCTSLSAITIPCGASLCDVLGLLELYITNTASEVSVINDYLNITRHDLLTTGEINSLASIPPSTSTDWQSQGAQMSMSIVHDDDNAYASSTGIWTCPTTGRYDLSFAIQMTCEETNGWFDSGTPGIIRAAIVKKDTNDVYIASTWSSVVIQSQAHISASIGGYNINSGDQLELKIINSSGESYGYDSATGDFARMSIRKV